MTEEQGTGVETITLGMGCFWSPDALFGHLPGVIRTRVGYAGGTAKQPTYREMGDHTETVEVEFAPAMIGLEQVLEVFWGHHNPANINEYKGRQYLSLLLYRSESQRQTIEQAIRRRREERGVENAETELSPFREFYKAEDRHQKYYVKRFPDALAKLNTLYPTEEDLVRSTLAARLNGLAKGYTSLERIKSEIGQWPVDTERKRQLLSLIGGIRW